MNQIIFKIAAFLLSVLLLINSSFANDVNIDGGGGGMGVGDAYNVWAVPSLNGGTIYDAEGLRVYLVNSNTGVPVSASVDITNFSIAKNNVFNGQGKTKHEYRFVNSSLNFPTTYNYVKVNTTKKLPQIIPWNEGSSVARIDAIKNWFLNPYYGDWVLAELGTDITQVRAGGYKLAVEPIAYFRYGGLHYAMTATEAALFNQAAGGDLRNKMGPLTSKNLPLSIFLKRDEFTASSYRVNRWTGSHTTNAADTDILHQLGIGYMNYDPVEEEEETLPGTSTLSYPSDTWVVTAFRLCNVRQSGGYWTSGYPLTSKYWATANISVLGRSYTITNIYIPSGSEQLIWVKWKTPATPQTVTMTSNTDRGFFYNVNNSGSSNMYVNYLTTQITIFDRNEENPPPDPTLNHTPDTYKYSASNTAANKSTMLGSSQTRNSWIVWDCDFVRYRRYNVTYSETDRTPYYPTGTLYVPETGIYTIYTTVRTYSRTYYTLYSSYTIYYVEVEFDEWIYRFDRINYSAEIRTNNMVLKPNSRNPTSYTSGGTAYMKSGYGVDLETQAYVSISINNPKTGNSTDSYYSADSTNYAASPQTLLTYFPEFGYRRYNRMLELISGKFVFKNNVYSTYNDRVHYSPWWFPDNQRYSVVTKSNYAYTPAGRLYMWTESNDIMIDGNLFSDWRVSPIRF